MPDDADTRLLARLRERFLGMTPGAGPYWRDEEELAAYDATFAQRIAWKWQAVLLELTARGWRPPEGPLLDWGCGSGVAGRAVLDAFGATAFRHLAVSDHAVVAQRFAMDRARTRFPGLAVTTYDPGPLGTLVVSHVLNELDAPARHDLLEAAARATAVLWVEPGTHRDSRALIAQREFLLAGGHGFRVVSPCPHAGPCGLLTPENERHWCHAFARPPSDVFTDPAWTRLGRDLGIDLRSLPFSHLVLDRRPPAATPASGSWLRILGRPEALKATTRLLACTASGVASREVPARTAPRFHRAARKDRAPAWLPDPPEDAADGAGPPA